MVAMKKSGKLCSGGYNSIRINAFRALICAIVSIVIFASTGMRSETEHWRIWLLSGLSNALMMFTWILCSEKMGLVVVETFGMIGSVVIPLLFSPLLYRGETIGIRQWIGCIFLLGAVIAVSRKPKTKSNEAESDQCLSTENNRVNEADCGCKKAGEEKSVSAISVVYLALYVISSAVVNITQKLYPTRAGKEYTLFFNMMTFAVVFVCYFLILGTGRVVLSKSVFPEESGSRKTLVLYVSIAAIMIYLYQLFSTLASGMIPSAVLYPLSRGITILLTALSEVVIFKQKITRNICMGVALSIIAIAFSR